MKKKRGGQPGNQNARKHGLYCGPLTPDEMSEFWNILNTTEIDPAMIVLRIKLISSLKADPGNRRLLRDASRMIARLYGAKLKLSRIETSILRKAVLKLIETGRDDASGSPELP